MIELLYGDIYVVGKSAFIILMLGQIANIGTGPVDLMLMMTNHQKDWLWITGVGLLITSVMNVILIPRFGYVGAATSVSITMAFIYLAGLIRVRQVHGIWPYDAQILKGLLVTGGAIIVLLLFIWIVQPASSFLHLVITSLLSFGFFGAGLLLLGLDETDKELLTVLRGKFLNYISK